MKRYLIIIFLSLFCKINAEVTVVMDNFVHNDNNYAGRHFIESGKEWMVVCATYEIFWSQRFFIDGDTLVGNRLCKKLMCEETDYENKESKTGLHMVVFEENGKVFYYPSEASSITDPILLYDFTAEPGDTLSLGGQLEDDKSVACYQIWGNLSMEYGDECFHGQLASIYNDSIRDVDVDSMLPLFQWYEGIGSVFHPFVKTQHNNHMSGPLYWLYECKVNGKVIYSRTMGLTLDVISPNNNRTVMERTNYYSIEGKKLSMPPLKGIYIKDGRKHLR